MSNANQPISNEYKINHVWYGDESDTAGTEGVVTIVSRAEPDTKQFVYGVSLCMPGDNFVKRTGANIARDRILDLVGNGSTRFAGTVRFTGPRRYYDIKTMIIVDMLCNMRGDLPAWAVMALKCELYEVIEYSFLG